MKWKAKETVYVSLIGKKWGWKLSAVEAISTEYKILWSQKQSHTILYD